jgi:outer membrane protein
MISRIAILSAVSLACLLTCVPSLSAQDAPPASALTIDEAVQTALSRNASVRVARDEVEAARARIAAAESGRLPSIQGTVGYQHVGSPSTITIPSADPAIPSRAVTVGAKDSVVTAVSARQAVYTGGRVSAQITGAQTRFDAALGQLGTTEEQVALQTRESYYNVLLSESLVRSAEQSLAAAKSQLDTAQAKYEAGTAARFDILRAQTQVSEAEQSTVQARNQVVVSQVALNRMLGAPLDTAYVLAEPTSPPLPDQALPVLIDIARRQRSELLTSRARLAAAEAGIRAAESERLPQISASASYQASSADNPIQPTGLTFGVLASMEVFDGGRIRADIREAKALRNEARVNLEDTSQAVEQDVRRAYADLQTARQTLDTAKARLAQAQEAYDVAAVRYEAGVSTATELADALAALTAARTSLDNTRFGYDISYARLQRALGGAIRRPD